MEETAGGGWASWLFSAVLLGFLLNLASDYTKPYIDSLIEKFSDSRRIQNEEKKAKFHRAVERAVEDPSEFYWRCTQLIIMFICFF